MKPRKAAVEEIVGAIANAQTMVIAAYRRYQFANMTKLRANARKEGVYLRVLKNALARRAVEGTSFAALADQMTGPLVYAASEDPVAAAKVLHKFSKKDDKIVLKAGSYNGDLLESGSSGRAGIYPESRRIAGETAWCYAGACFRLCTCAGCLGGQAEQKPKQSSIILH